MKASDDAIDIDRFIARGSYLQLAWEEYYWVSLEWAAPL